MPQLERRRRLGPNPSARIAVHALALLPLALLAFDYYTDNLSANPIQDITFRTGKPALILLVASLAVTPANTLLGWRRAIPFRRTLGLYAFFYAVLHFLTFTVVDYALDPVLLKEGIFEKPYALVGFAAFLTLVPLALTSTKGWQRRLGRRWTKLHRLVYLTALLVVVHYVWLVKSDVRQPLAWGAVVISLLLLRVPAVRRRAAALRANLSPPKRDRQQNLAGTVGTGRAERAPVDEDSMAVGVGHVDVVPSIHLDGPG